MVGLRFYRYSAQHNTLTKEIEDMFISNVKGLYDVEGQELDRGDLVQTILIVAGFAVATILVVGWISTSLINKGADIADCIEGASTFEAAGAAEQNCKKKNHAANKGKSFKDTGGYKDRYGKK